MRRSPFSSSWYRVAGLRPRLRSHARIFRQTMRGQIWYVLEDEHGGQFHRLSPAAHLAVCLLDGRRTVREVWEAVGRKLGPDQPTQDEMIRLLAQLHAADLLSGELPPDAAEMSARAERVGRRSLLLRLRNPLALRFPLLDPDRFLELTLPLVRWAFTASGFLLWLVGVLGGLTVAVTSWPALTADLAAHAFTVQNLAIAALVYPFVKALHELGHGYATKAWGGEVHEMGIMLLVLLPVPYVDATAASGFQSKWQRATVAGAGIMVELLLAAMGVIVWASVQPGLVSMVALNIALVCSLSTLLFNGNPLLRFDGYYVLGDLAEISNLATRANRYIRYLLQRHALGLESAVSPVSAPGERTWFLFYGIAAFLYRTVVVLGIAFFIAGKLFFVGALLALWAIASAFIWPLAQGLRFILMSPQLRGRRGRAIALSAGAGASAAALLLAVPLPYATLAEGVVLLPESTALRARSDGWVVRVTASPGEQVGSGETVMLLEDPLLAGRATILDGRIAELQARLEAVRMGDLVQANILREQLRHTEAAAELLGTRLVGLKVTADQGGRLILPRPGDLPGRMVRRGDLLGYVVAPDDPIIRVLVPQAEVDLVRRRVEHVEVRFVDRAEVSLPARILREVPAATAKLPSAALATTGGGAIEVDPMRGDGRQGSATYYQFDLTVPGATAYGLYGGRVHARFDHGREPVGWRLLRQLRQLFLGQFQI